MFVADPGLRLDQATYGWVDSALALVARISKPEFLTAMPLACGFANLSDRRLSAIGRRSFVPRSIAGRS